MKRRVLELGRSEQELFISHSTDFWPLADALINVGPVDEVSAAA